MLQRLGLAGAAAIAMASSFCLAQSASPNGVKTLDPPGAIKAEGTWSLGARAGDFVFVAGMQGVDPATNTLVQEPQARAPSLAQYQADCAIRGCESAGLRAAYRLRQRPAPVRADGGQSAGGALGQTALSAAHHARSSTPV